MNIPIRKEKIDTIICPNCGEVSFLIPQSFSDLIYLTCPICKHKFQFCGELFTEDEMIVYALSRYSENL